MIPLVALVSIGIASAVASSATALYPTVANKDLDCAVRTAARDFANAIQPDGPADSSAIFDALELGVYCGLARPRDRHSSTGTKTSRIGNWSHSLETFYVDAVKGNDSNAGTEAAPFQSISRGVDACQAARQRSGSFTGKAYPCSVLLRDTAPFILSSTLALGAENSGLSIEAFPGEHPVISGATPLPLSTVWSPWRPGKGTNVWVTRASLDATPGSLFVDGLRMIHARWPNANPETDLIPVGYSNATTWQAPRASGPPVVVPLPAITRPWDHYFPNWTWALNGTGLG